MRGYLADFGFVARSGDGDQSARMRSILKQRTTDFSHLMVKTKSWKTVHELLGFGFIPTSGDVESYLPEDIFYLLAMKAKNAFSPDIQLHEKDSEGKWNPTTLQPSPDRKVQIATTAEITSTNPGTTTPRNKNNPLPANSSEKSPEPSKNKGCDVFGFNGGRVEYPMS